MKIGVLGFCHFGDIVAACLASKGHEVIQCDEEPFVQRQDQKRGDDEPGWSALQAAHQWRVSNRFDALYDCDLIWSCYDVPLRADGASNDAVVMARLIGSIGAFVERDIPMLFSTQWTVGSTRSLQRIFGIGRFAYVQENIRVGHGVEDFLHQSRIVLGGDNILGGPLAVALLDLLQMFATEVVMMSPTSAEMSKHALNAFLALQITFINEIARLCDVQGAQVTDVSRALMTDARISPQAYLKAGGPFGGGSLQRDVLTLNALAWQAKIGTPVLSAIMPSNYSIRPDGHCAHCGGSVR